MSEDWSVPGWAVLATLVALLLLVVLLVVALVRSRTRTTAALEAARADAVALAAQVDAIERRLAEPVVRTDETEYVVTMLGRDDPDAPDVDERTPAPVVPAPLFADLVLREGVVQAASLAAGLRRALAPEMRHRIRLEMRREVKRARKQRRADLRQAKREFEARQRGDVAA
ncbi:MAG: hypothetical protein Q7T56_06890 [Nocardioidaceae bacterium]|nr:hypothetical protein [Nocardioidaceae bacterium]